MDRQRQANAFTMLESMLVLLIAVVLLRAFSIPPTTSSFFLFMQQMQMRTLTVQETAFACRERKYIEVYDTYAFFDDVLYEFPEGVVCENFQVHFTPAGNISKAGTFTCSGSGTAGKLVFQLGSGRMRYEEL